jgi:hypothetical protein
MAKLGRLIAEAIVLDGGRQEFLRRMSHPFWFQSFGAVMGMDWHSSGITTSVMGALKRGLAPVSRELGIHVCGGRGKHSRKTPGELVGIGERVGLDGDALARTSRLVAKVDSAAVQDGFDLYLHSFIVSDDGDWAVVQQGMNARVRRARRYHWLSEGLESFLDDPHAAIADERPSSSPAAIVNLADRRAEACRRAQVELVSRGPAGVVDTAKRLRERPDPGPVQPLLPHLALPDHHELRASDVVLRRLHATLAAAADRGPKDFAELLLVPGVGARTVESLAMVSEVVYGTPCRFTDPGRFSCAHGGKDGHPFPVPLRVYDRTIAVLRRAIEGARLGNGERLAAIRRLDQQARRLEGWVAGPELPEWIASERRASASFGGRTVFDDAKRS